MAITRAGRLFAQHARETLSSLDAGIEAVRQDIQIVQGRLRISLLQSLEPYLSIPNLLRVFQETYPRVKLVVLNSNDTSVIPSLVRSGELDVAVYPAPSPHNHHGLQIFPFVKDSLAVICAKTHPLCSQSKVTMPQLEGERFIDLGRERTLRSVVDQIFASRQMIRNTAFEISDEPTAVQFVEANLGVAIFPRALANLYSESRNICVIPIFPQTPKLPSWLVTIVCRVPRVQSAGWDLSRLFLEAARPK